MAEGAGERFREPARRLAAVGAIGVTAAAGLPLAYYAMFSGFREYDDEGYLLLSLRDYARGAALYDAVYSQYGPAYYQLLTALFGALGVGFTHTAGRTLVLALWLAAGVLCAAATYRLTGNLAVTVGTQLLVVQTLLPMRNEPPHPGGLLAVLLAGTALAGTLPGGGPRAIAGWRGGLLGGLLAAATLMKVNVGVLASLAVGFALLASAPVPRGARRLAAALVLVAPVALTAPLLGEPAVAAFLALVLAAAAATLTVAPDGAGDRPEVSRCELGTGIAAFVAVAGLSLAREIGRGTTLPALLDGVLLEPARQLRAIALLLPVAPAAALTGVAGLALALAWRAADRRGWTARGRAVGIRGAAQLAAGSVVWLVADERLPVGPLAPLPLLWLALLPAPAGARAGGLGRRLLVMLAVLQTLHAYPVAGSQVAWATFLFLPVGAILLADGWRRLVAALGPAPACRLRGVRAAGAALGLLLVGGVATSLSATEARVRAAFEAGVPLGLPGAETIRVRPPQARLYRVLAGNLARCRTFVTMPGLNSLYLFSGVDPPSTRNTTLWVALLTPAEQADIAARLARTPAPVCAVRRPDAAFDGQDTPLTRYIRREFVTVFTLGDYAFMLRRAAAAAAPTG